MKKYITIAFLLAAVGCNGQLQQLHVAANKRFLQTADGQPFFWMGDTGWHLFKKLKRQDVIQYLDTRKQQGFNVVQAMVLHQLTAVNVYGDTALLNGKLSAPNTTPGKNFEDGAQYDYWDNIDWILDEAEKRGIYIAMVAVWGKNIQDASLEEVKLYAAFLAHRYKSHSNIIWLNGGDIKGGDALDKWNTLGATIRAIDTTHLITYHPRGRNSSSAWFHNEPWLDFNMFQSGHRSYAQDTLSDETLHYGEDNWRYVNDDYKLQPTKPVLDGEPSYEGIPYGLHWSNQPYWQDYEIRRYAYWSVFAGGCGFTYGHNAVMQFYSPGDQRVSYFPKVKWQAGLLAPGATQVHHLKDLIVSKSYFDRVPDQSLVMDDGKRYNKIVCTRGNGYAMFYVYNGRSFTVAADKLGWQWSDAYWFSPKDGTKTVIYTTKNNSVQTFDPPGKKANGNDWVLVLEKANK